MSSCVSGKSRTPLETYAKSLVDGADATRFRVGVRGSLKRKGSVDRVLHSTSKLWCDLNLACTFGDYPVLRLAMAA